MPAQPPTPSALLRSTLAVAVLAVSTGLLTAAPAQAATGTITGLAGKCLDVAGASTADGTAVQL
ncbi:RICIN domain-containing protein, partial [Streptomyces sp. NPDC001340]